jgi:hypothetical protein
LPRTFAERARDAGEGEVGQYACPASVNRHHVVDVESGLLASLGQPAVFAAVVRPLNHLLPQKCRNHRALTMLAGSTVLPAGAAGREVRSGPPTLRPLVFPQWLKPAPAPACPVGFGAVSERLWADGTAPDRLASGVRLEWLEAYASLDTSARLPKGWRLVHTGREEPARHRSLNRETTPMHSSSGRRTTVPSAGPTTV